MRLFHNRTHAFRNQSGLLNVNLCFPPKHIFQIYPVQHASAQIRIGETGIAEHGFGEIGVVNDAFFQQRFPEVCVAKRGVRQIHAAQVAVLKTAVVKVAAQEFHAGQIGIDKAASHALAVLEGGREQTGAGKLAIDERGVLMARAAELRKAEITAGERAVSRHQRLHGASAKTAPLKGVAGQLLFGKIIVGKGFILVAENFFGKHKKHPF